MNTFQRLPTKKVSPTRIRFWKVWRIILLCHLCYNQRRSRNWWLKSSNCARSNNPITSWSRTTWPAHFSSCTRGSCRLRSTEWSRDTSNREKDSENLLFSTLLQGLLLSKPLNHPFCGILTVKRSKVLFLPWSAKTIKKIENLFRAMPFLNIWLLLSETRLLQLLSIKSSINSLKYVRKVNLPLRSLFSNLEN